MSTDIPDDESAALKRAQAQFALAERAAGIGAWRYDLRTGQTEWSPGLYAMFGLERDRMSMGGGDWLMNHIEPADVQALEAVLTRAVSTGEPFHYRARSRAGHGPAMVIDTHGEVECGADGGPIALVAVARNVTHQLDTENARRSAEQWYRCMADQASDIILLFGKDGQVLFASDALNRVLGLTPADVGGLHFLDHVHPEDLEEAQKIAAPPAPGETKIASYRSRHRDGHYIWIESSLRSIFDERGEMINFIAVSRDVTERKRSETETRAARDEAIAANIAKSTFLANMSHELRTPLNAIIGFAEIMREQMFGPLGCEQYADYSRLIHESGELLLELISDVLDMAKVEAGKLELHVQTVPLGLLIDDCLRLVEERAKAQGLRLVTELSPALTDIRADRRSLKQILLNLLSNAVKFTMAGGIVRVRTASEAGGVLLQVEDDGAGIPAEDLPRLGNPFEQARTDATLTAGGAGLGLALVRALAEKHGGWMRIASEVGAGTTVSVWLPREPVQVQSAA